MSENIRILSSQTVYAGRVFDVTEDTVSLPHGVTTTFATVEHKGAIVVLPITDNGEIILVRQYRHAVKKELLELPAGGLGIGEDPSECALRELAEETGVSAARIDSLGVIYPAPGFCSEILHCFIARDLYEHILQGDDDEQVEVVHLSVAAVQESILKGEIVDAKTIALYFKAQALGYI